MSDDVWGDRNETEDFSEFGSLFDDSAPTKDLPSRASADDRLSFDTPSSGALPHWSDKAVDLGHDFSVGESAPPPADDPDVDVWSSFTSETPIWKDDAPIVDEPAIPADRRTGQQSRVTGQQSRVSGQQSRVSGQPEVAERAPGRITIGTDPSGITRRPPVVEGRRKGATPVPKSRQRPAPAPRKGRDMPTAIAVGMLLAAAFLAALNWRPIAVVAVVTVVLGLGAIEFYSKVAEKGYRPASPVGIATCVIAPLAAYWVGDSALTLVVAFGFMVVAGGFIGARNVEAGPMPNISITTLGIVWIGFLGSFAMLILRLSTTQGVVLENVGTDTLFLVVLGVAANDIGAMLVGSAAGRTPLRGWISPNKTVEGLIGGTLMTLIAMIVFSIMERSSTWVELKHLVLLAIVISCMAPMGDLVESMFKRNLDVKDFGSIIKGHGGILDRFDGYLFALPAVYYLTIVLEPWAA